MDYIPMIKLKDYFFDWFQYMLAGFAIIVSCLALYMSLTTNGPEPEPEPAPVPELKSKYELFESPCEWPWYIDRLDRCTR